MSDNKTLSTTAIDDAGSQPPDQKSLDSGSADAGGAPLGKTLSNAGTITKTKLTLLETLGLRDPKPDARPAWDGRNPSWFRSTFFQVTILGICSFLAPGVWSSTASLGAGGSQDPSTVNAANSLTFALMVITSFFTSSLASVTSLKFVLMIGTMGYAPYAAGLYLNSATGAQWLVILGAGLCGVSAGFFWSAEGALALGIPEISKQARYISYWLMFRVLGQLLGGIINLALNYNNSAAGSISTDTYLVFVALQCLGPFVAMLLSPPHKMQRTDKTPVYLHVEATPKTEVRNMWNVLRQPKILLLLPIIWQSTWSEALIGTFAVNYYTVRSRALGSLLAAVSASISNYILGFFLDWKKPSMNTRAKSAFIFIYTLSTGVWIWAIYIMHEYHNTVPKPLFDWTSDGYGRGFALYIFLQIVFNTMYELNYWVVGAITDDPNEMVRYAAVIRGVESAGQCVSYGVNSTSFRLDAVAGLNFGQFALSIIPAWLVIRKIGILEDGTKIHYPRTYAKEHDRDKLKQSGLAEADYDLKGDK